MSIREIASESMEGRRGRKARTRTTVVASLRRFLGGGPLDHTSALIRFQGSDLSPDVRSGHTQRQTCF